MLFSVHTDGQLHLPDAIFRRRYLTVYVFAVFFVLCYFLNFTALVIAVPATSNKILYFDYSTIDFNYKILNYFVSATYFEIIRLQ